MTGVRLQAGYVFAAAHTPLWNPLS